jgi:hypothetical protein
VFGSLPGGAGRTVGTCGGIGSESAYAIGLCPGRSIALNTCNGSTAFDHVLYARRNGCDAGAVEVGCSATMTGSCAFTSGRTLTFGAGLPTGLYYFFIDSTAIASTDRTFQIAVTIP